MHLFVQTKKDVNTFYKFFMWEIVDITWNKLRYDYDFFCQALNYFSAASTLNNYLINLFKIWF